MVLFAFSWLCVCSFVFLLYFVCWGGGCWGGWRWGGGQIVSLNVCANVSVLSISSSPKMKVTSHCGVTVLTRCVVMRIIVFTSRAAMWIIHYFCPV